ncbi:SpaA isopeptide-forming pilin-related protein, partial [Bacillus sp. SS-TM]
ITVDNLKPGTYYLQETTAPEHYKLDKQSHTVQEDYETLMNIMNRARKLAVMDDEERSQTSFRMDRNGNLEKIAE